MAQAQKAPKQPQDPYAQRGKTLASSVQRLRGWVGSDPSKGPELADALVALTAHRLLGHGYALAAADAQESVRQAAQLLTAEGPLGPYTSLDDAARYVDASVHLALIQTGLGFPDAAGRMMEPLLDTQRELRDRGLDDRLSPLTAVWALTAQARIALANGDVGAANAYADAVLARVGEAGLGSDPDTAYVAVDADRLASDCRWAAGRAEDSLTYLHKALDSYDRFVDGRLATPARLSPALLERLAEPLFGLYRDMADRLAARGEGELGLVTRRSLVDLLGPVAKRLGDPARIQLASALTDLADDLRSAGRVDEADTAAAEAASVLPTGVHTRKRVALGSSDVTWSALSPTAAYASTTASTGGSVTDRSAEQQRETAAWLEAERQAAHRLETERLAAARIETERREAARVRAEAADAERAAAERASAEQAAALEAEQRAAAEEAERIETKRRREERLEQHRLEVEQRESERLADDPFEVARLEYQRASQPVVVEPVVESEPEPEPVVEPQPQPEPVVEPEPIAVEPEPAVAPESEPEAVIEPDPEPQPEPDELVIAEQAWSDARSRGDRKAARAALEVFVEMLRPRAEADLPAYGPQLQAALEDLSSARLRGGDVWGSRAPSKEAKALAKALGR